MNIGLMILIVPLIGLLALFGALATDQVPPAVMTAFRFLVGGAVGLVAISVFVGALGTAAQTIGGVFRYVPTILPISRNRRDQVERGENGSVTAYRYFEVLDGEFWSVGVGVVGDNPITGRERGSYRGGWNISDRVPTLNNDSGIYAAKTKDSHILAPYRFQNTVLAKVELSGRIVEGEYGYRAQRCRIVDVYAEVPNGHW